MTLLHSLTDHISQLPTVQGWNKGQSFHLFPWEKRFLSGVFGSEFNQGDAALTLARGAGKTSFVATLGESTLTGPLIEEHAETVVVAPSLGQARILFAHVKRFLGAQLEDKATWRTWDNAQLSSIEHKKIGQILRCLGCEPKRLHGLAPKLIIVDEPAQFPTNSAEEAHSVLRTAMGKIEGSRMVALGTRPLEGVEHFFNDMLGESDYIQAHQCTKDDPLFRRSSWEKACPSLRHGMPSLLAEIRAEADRFMNYNEEKGWRMDWEEAVARWTPRTPAETAEYKHKPFELFQHEERTPESEARVWAGFKDLKQGLKAKPAGKERP